LLPGRSGGGRGGTRIAAESEAALRRIIGETYLDELERWFAVAIAKLYHLRPHDGLRGQAPLRRWEEGARELASEGSTVPAPRDPRDLSRVFVLDAVDGSYLEVATRDLSRPAISLWEHRLALRRVRARHRGEVDEAALFAAVEEMRGIEREAARLTRSARRDRVRRAAAPAGPAAPPPVIPQADPIGGLAEQPAALPAKPEAPPRPFDDIEQW